MREWPNAPAPIGAAPDFAASTGRLARMALSVKSNSLFDAPTGE
jgi:hypothetical protein